MRRHMRVFPILLSFGLMATLVLMGGSAQADPTRGRPGSPSTLSVPQLMEAASTPRSRWRDRRLRSTANSRSALAFAPRRGSLAPIPDPGIVELDATTQTLYVVSLADGSIKVVDARTCTAGRQHCRAPVASFSSGTNVSYMLIDSRTRTMYVSYGGDDDGNGSDLAVLDLRRCHVRDTSGCGNPVARIAIPGAAGSDLDRATGTLFVGTFADSVAVINAATCNARTVVGCGVVTTLATGSEPLFVLVDSATRSLYVTNAGDPEAGNALSIVDISSCNARSIAGCGRAPVTTRTGPSPVYAAIDRSSSTLYVTSGRGSVSVIDQRTCNARVTSGCSSELPPSFRTGPDAQVIEFSATSPSMYVLSFGSDTIDVIDTRHCRAQDTSGCTRPHRSIQTASGEAWWLTFDPDTDSLYVTTITAGGLQVIDATQCSAERTDGCRREAPSTPGGGGVAIDPGRHTYYQTVGPEGGGVLRFLDTRTCTAARPSGCDTTVPSVPLGNRPGSMAIDLGTSTLYVADYGLQALHVIDTTRCNVSRQDGCTPLYSIPIPAINVPQVNSRTHTVYVTQGGLGTVAVIPGVRCNRSNVSGCGDPVFTVAAGRPADIAWPDPETNTIYVANGDASTLTLLDGAACDQLSAGCRAVATSEVGFVPVSVAFDPATHSAFVAIFSFGEERGRVAVLDTRVCNVANTSGCGTTWPTTPTARGTLGATFIPSTRTLVTANFRSATISLVDTRHCNATDASRCGRRSTEIAVGRFSPVSWADPGSNTLYVNNQWEQSTSLIDLTHPCRSGLCFHA